MAEGKQLIGIVGGTFDPIHFGHLRTALELYERLGLDHVRFIPCRSPVHKEKAHTTVEHRVAMLQLAIDDQDSFVLDDRELVRETPSYMVPTLESLCDDFPNAILCLILGTDTFAHLNSWYRWQAILSLCHIIAVKRPNFQESYPEEIKTLLKNSRIEGAELLKQYDFGKVLLTQTTSLDISATMIRTMIAHGRCPRYLLPEAVRHYVIQEGIYLNHPV